MRFFFFILLFCKLCFGSVLSVDEAFKITHGSDETGVFVDFKLGKDIFLYKKQLKIMLDKKDITNLLNLPQSTQINGEERFYENLHLNLSAFMLSREFQKDTALLSVYYQGCSNEGFCYRPLNANFKITSKNGHFKISSINANEFKNTNLKKEEFNFNKGFYLTLISFFGYGILLSLTPCTLPMIPILSSMILAKGTQGRSKFYNLWLCFIFIFFMSLAYAIAGIITAMLGAGVQGLLQKPIVLIFFACIFVLLALACFGAFSFQMPANIQKFANKLSFKGKGVVGIASMGFLSALIVGPCTAAPLAAALLYIANSNDLILGGFSLFFLSLGMGLPLLFVGLGISFLKPGIWTKRINTFFGFLMLAMAIYILARFMPANFKLIAFGALGVFFVSFMGLFESANSAYTRFKKAFLILILAYALALFLGGLFGGKSLLNPLNLSTSNKTQISQNKLYFKEIKSLKALQDEITNSQKPILLEFTASWCENCKLLEELTFQDERIQKTLKDFSLLRVDITEGSLEEQAIMKEFQAFAPPTLLFFKKSEQVLRLDGFIGADEFLKKFEAF
ncbi:thiol:disulfide interchange protein [Campylobacter sp. MIT 99-7217]|uniref:protein-disulfide reductase DsbD n=1 Tax=Campylobacter sp. MIT 99-7217 TaxID=535091 RepID=UPI0011582F93|nr:protein-disulfide reductase DsbD [Campylobacter sp. MIT 99-7217]TQR28937.1 thiol:disulfide interchange protein [Campylobacter sp. MIT 99-7217]